jgi:hypothetical protein
MVKGLATAKPQPIPKTQYGMGLKHSKCGGCRRTIVAPKPRALFILAAFFAGK